MNEKFELTNLTTTVEDSKVLYRIRALRDIPAMAVKAGDFGGFVESMENLDSLDNSWIAGEASVYGNSFVTQNSVVKDDSVVQDSIIKNSMIALGAQVYNNSQIIGSGIWESIVNNSTVESSVIIGKSGLWDSQIKYSEVRGSSLYETSLTNSNALCSTFNQVESVKSTFEDFNSNKFDPSLVKSGYHLESGIHHFESSYVKANP